jgi:hypothetical protein
MAYCNGACILEGEKRILKGGLRQHNNTMNIIDFLVHPWPPFITFLQGKVQLVLSVSKGPFRAPFGP